MGNGFGLVELTISPRPGVCDGGGLLKCHSQSDVRSPTPRVQGVVGSWGSPIGAIETWLAGRRRHSTEAPCAVMPLRPEPPPHIG